MLNARSVLTLAGLLAVVTHATPARAALRVVTTTTDLASLARELGGDRVTVDSICQGAQDPHFVQARPSYMVLLSRADLLLAVGLELEVGWLPLLIEGARNPRVRPGQPGYFEAASAVQAIEVPAGAVDRSQGDVHALGNPHLWLDPVRVRDVVNALARRMSELDPEGAAQYEGGRSRFVAALEQAMARWATTLEPLRGRQVISYHRTFNYLLQRYGLVVADYVEERPGVPPPPAHLARLVRHMRDAGVKVILHEVLYDQTLSRSVAAKTGAQVLVLPTSVGGVAGTPDYLKLVDHLVNALVTAFASRQP